MDKAVVILSFYQDNSEIYSMIFFICGHFPCSSKLMAHAHISDNARPNSNKQMCVLFGSKILIKSETYCVRQKY